MFNNTNKQNKANTLNAAVEEFLANGGTITQLAPKDTRKRRQPIMQQQVHEEKEEHDDYSDLPNDVRWNMLMQILRDNPGKIQMRWNDGRVANSTAELYGL